MIFCIIGSFFGFLDIEGICGPFLEDVLGRKSCRTPGWTGKARQWEPIGPEVFSKKVKKPKVFQMLVSLPLFSVHKSAVLRRLFLGSIKCGVSELVTYLSHISPAPAAASSKRQEGRKLGLARLSPPLLAACVKHNI